MNSKIVKLLVLSVTFLAILSATSIFIASTHPSMKTDNLTSKAATEIHQNTHLTGDPVGGGIPNVQIVPLGDPVGGGIPNVQIVHTIAD